MKRPQGWLRGLGDCATEYDENGNVKKLILKNEVDGVESLQETEYGYDAFQFAGHRPQ